MAHCLLRNPHCILPVLCPKVQMPAAHGAYCNDLDLAFACPYLSFHLVALDVSVGALACWPLTALNIPQKQKCRASRHREILVVQQARINFYWSVPDLFHDTWLQIGSEGVGDFMTTGI